MNRRVYWLLSVVLGIAIGVLTYRYLVANLSLAATNAVLSACGIGLLARNHLVLKDRFGRLFEGAPNWWNAAIGPLIIVAGVFGISPTLPIPSDLGFALTALVASAIVLSWNVGVAATVRMMDLAESRTGES